MNLHFYFWSKPYPLVTSSEFSDTEQFNLSHVKFGTTAGFRGAVRLMGEWGLVGHEVNPDLMRRAAEARAAGQAAKDPMVRMEMARIAEMWERLARMGSTSSLADDKPKS